MGNRMSRWAAAMLLTILAGCGTPEVARKSPPSYEASIVRTQYGVPHITAKDWKGLGYGQGYVVAEDNLCVFADAILTYRGERSRYFGAQAKVTGVGVVGRPPNLAADLYFRQVLSGTQMARFRDAQPPEVKALFAGYAEGYSRYVREIRAGKHTGRHSECRSSPWLSEIAADDLYRRSYTLSTTLGAGQYLEAIANAQPPGASSAASATAARGAWDLPREGTANVGSNMIGFGSSATGAKHGLLLGNPHWLWGSVDSLHQVHLKIPGHLDVQGGQIIGIPGVGIGFNNNVAWSATVTNAARFTLYRLKLVKGDPTAYLYDGQVRRMKPTQVTVQVRNDDGSLSEVTRALYSSHYGPILGTDWNGEQALSIRDANAANFRFVSSVIRTNRAGSLEEYMRIVREESALPFQNTIAVGRNDGRVWYADIGTTPNVSDAQMAQCQVGKSRLFTGYAYTLDGSRSQCEWNVDKRSAQPGIFPADEQPQLIREDYASNLNDSYWLANARAPLTGFPVIMGGENQEPSLRTRLGHILVKERLSGTDGLPDKLADSVSVREFALNARTLSAELFLDEVLKGLCPAGAIELDEPRLKVDVREACEVLARWDRRGNLDSVGAHIWDQFWRNVERIPSAERYLKPFDPAAPLDTPRNLNIGDKRISQALALGVKTIQDSAVPLSAPRSAYQYLLDASGERIALAGGCADYGYFSIVCTDFRKDGPSVRRSGSNSYIQVVGFTDRGVEAYTLLLASQSSDPASPHFRDYARAYSSKSWLRAPFTDEEVKAAAVTRTELRSAVE